MELLVHGLHRTLRGPKSTWESFHSCYQKMKSKENESPFFKSTIHLGSFSYSFRKLSGWLICQKMKKTTLLKAEHTWLSLVTCVIDYARRERPKAIRKTADKVLTCSTQTLVVRIWFFKSYKNKRKEKERNRIYIRRHTHTHKKVPGLPQFSQFI